MMMISFLYGAGIDQTIIDANHADGSVIKQSVSPIIWLSKE